MKKKLSGLGILLFLLVKHPPVPEFTLFHKHRIVSTRVFTLRELTREIGWN